LTASAAFAAFAALEVAVFEVAALDVQPGGAAAQVQPPLARAGTHILVDLPNSFGASSLLPILAL
jgi:hypothetical protein